MQPDVIRRLNAVNRAFYAITAADFDATRQAPWAGWFPLLPYLSGVRRVLDVGCGNGRFGVFLRQHVGESAIEYHGVDNSADLLERARGVLNPESPTLSEKPRGAMLKDDAIPPQPDTQNSGLATHHLFLHDFIDSALPADLTDYDVVAAFGVLHHVPGYETRRAFIRDLAGRLRSGGVLMLAAWRFLDDPALRARVAPWPDDLVNEVESGDALLDWRRGQTALRYCHHCDDSEFDALMADSGLTVESRYFADGGSGRMNLYAVARRD